MTAATPAPLFTLYKFGVTWVIVRTGVPWLTLRWLSLRLLLSRSGDGRAHEKECDDCTE